MADKTIQKVMSDFNRITVKEALEVLIEERNAAIARAEKAEARDKRWKASIRRLSALIAAGFKDDDATTEAMDNGNLFALERALGITTVSK